MISSTVIPHEGTPQKIYFRPHFVDENKEWLSIIDVGREYIITKDHYFVPNDYELVFIKSGYVNFFCKTNNKPDNFAMIVGRNSIANAGGAITGANRFSRITTDSSATIVIFDSYTFWDIEQIKKIPAVYYSMACGIAKTIDIFSERAHDISFLPCAARLCKTLLEISEPVFDKNSQYLHHITQNDLALFSGMHPVTVSRLLKKLREQEIIGKLSPSDLEVRDYKALRQISALQRIV